MKSPAAYPAAIYSSTLKKTFKSALAAFIEREFPQMGGPLVVDLFVSEMDLLINEFFPPTKHFKMGQILWFAVAKEEQPCYGKTMAKTNIRPVILTLVNHEDIQKRIAGTSLPQIKQRVVARVCQEAYAQGAVLSQADIALLTHMSDASISNYIKAYQQENECTLPYRGTVHDMGRSVTHKSQICRKRLVERKSVSQTAQETHHSPQAVQRYEVALNRILFCLGKGLSIEETSFVTTLSKNLVIEYQNIGKEIETMKENQGEIDFDDLPL